MPVIKYRVGRVYQENAKMFADGWDMQQVKDRLVSFANVYRYWQDFGEVLDLRPMGKLIQFDFKPSKLLSVNDPKIKGGPDIRAINPNDKTVAWLILLIDFETQLRPVLNKVKGRPPVPELKYQSVSEFVSIYINDKVREVVGRLDATDIGEEAAK